MRIRIGVSVVFALLAGLLIGCGGGSSTPTNPTPPTITGTLTGAPSSLSVGATAQLTVTVSNDSSNGGVDWSCATAPCGSFSPTHTASGAATTYTAPTSAGTVTINATSTTSGKAIATATITINAATSVSVAISGAPASLTVNGTSSITATVTNDSTNAGVDWTCTTAPCGSFNPTHTASGVATVYTAPAAVGTVIVTATSTASPTSTQTASITISAATSSANLSGSYAFALVGHDAASHAYSLAGSVALDGNGNVTGGVQDYNNGHGKTSPQPSGDSITGGTYTIGNDGRGTLKLITNNTNLGVAGTESFSISVVNNKHVLIAQTDLSGTGSGTLDFQTIVGGLGQVNGNYSFTVAGANGNNPEVFGGRFTANGSGAITALVVDSNSNGTVTLHGTNTGTYTAADASGRGTIAFGGNHYTYYAIGPEVLRIIIIDSTETDLGTAFGQGAGPFSNASLNGSFVFKNSSAETGAGSYVSAGLLTTDGAGNISSGFADVDEAGSVTSAAVTGTYTMASNGYGSITIAPGATQHVAALGVYAIDPALNPSDPNSSTGGGGALILDLDTQDIGGGLLLPRATSPTFTGNYSAAFRSFTSAGVEQNLVGQIAVGNAGAITGNADAADLGTGSPHLGVALSGTVTADASHAGRFTLPLTVAIGVSPPALNFAVYQASTGDLFWVEVDATQYASGTIEQQQ